LLQFCNGKLLSKFIVIYRNLSINCKNLSINFFSINGHPLGMNNADSEPEPDTVCINSGWGLTTGGGISAPNNLQKVNINIVSEEDCESIFPGYIKPGMICAGESGHGSCNVSSTDK
jgi:hypothetical protein